MRICLISREFPPDTGWGGIGTFTFHHAHALKELGHDVEVVSLVGAHEAKHRLTDPKESNGAIPINRVAPLSIADKKSFFNFSLPVTRPMLQENVALWSELLRLHAKNPFDVVEAPEHFAEGIFPSISKVAPLVLRLHTPHFKLLSERFHNFTPSLDHQFLSLLERLAMLSADALVSPSDDLARFVASDLGIPLQRIAIIRNPVDTANFHPDGARALPNDGKLTILFVGRLEERKGIHFLIDAIPQVIRSCPNTRFVVLGSDTQTARGNGSVLSELKQSLASQGAVSEVHFVQHVPLSEMPNYYRAADICVLPSLYDNAPMTALEAMSCGKPVVSTSAGGTKEYVIHDHCGLIVPPRDSTALAHSLLELLKNTEKRLHFGVNARQRIINEFTRQKTAKLSVELYESACTEFSQRRTNSLYQKNPEELLRDLSRLIEAYEKAAYDLVYTHSFCFRLKHQLTRLVNMSRVRFSKLP